MLRDLLSSRLIQLGFVFFVIIVGGSLLYSWHVQRITEAEFGKRLPAVQALEKQNETRTANVEKPPPGETTQSGHWHGDEWHATEPHRQDDLPLTTSLETSKQGVLSRESPQADVSTTQLKALKKQIDDINARIQAKYPEFAELATLTPAEIFARYPTEADKLELIDRSNSFLKDFLQEIRTVFADAPVESREFAYDMIYKQLEQTLGAETAKESMEILRGTLE